MAVMKVPVTKGKGFVEIDTDAIPPNVWAEVVAQGLKTLVNRGMTKITVAGLKDDQLDAAKAAAMEKGQANVSDMLAGKVRVMGAKAEGKVSGVIMTEARRLARNIIKDGLKRAGEKVSHYDASEITKAANALIASSPELIDQAKASIAERDTVKIAIDLKAIPVSDKKIKAIAAKAEKEKADKPLSAAKAGKTAKRQKPGAQAQA